MRRFSLEGVKEEQNKCTSLSRRVFSAHRLGPARALMADRVWLQMVLLGPQTIIPNHGKLAGQLACISCVVGLQHEILFEEMVWSLKQKNYYYKTFTIQLGKCDV